MGPAFFELFREGTPRYPTEAVPPPDPAASEG